MSVNTVYCHILGGNVTVTTDLKGVTTNVVCPEFNRVTFACRLKAENKGIFRRALDRTIDKRTGTRKRICEFTDVNQSPWDQYFDG